MIFRTVKITPRAFGIPRPQPVRFFVGIIIAMILCIYSATPANAGFPDKVFAPYVDVLLWPTFSIQEMYEKTGQKYYTLAFVVSGGGCKPSWGGVIPVEDDWYRDQIDFIRSVGGDVILSFGGANGTELAMGCSSVKKLQAAYQSVIDRYDLKWVDFDIEGWAVADRPSINRRNKAIKGLQEANPNLKVAFCLPVMPQGLTHDGLFVLENAKKNNVRIDVVNPMAMDYGDSIAPDPEGKMGQYAIDAAENTYKQMQGIGVDAKIGVTPMIGQNDVPSERFYISDTVQLLDWARSQGDLVTLLSFWSANRDNGGCPGGSAQAKCSGVAQEEFEFTNTLFSFSGDGGGGGNIPPSVNIISPSHGETFDVGDNVIIKANAQDTDGDITRVEFFLGSVSIGVDDNTPFSITLYGVEAGIHILTAKATDNASASRTSPPIQILVGDVCTTPEWNAATVYWSGDTVSHNGLEWEAQWWTLNEEPGTTGKWGVWKELGPCGGNSNIPPSVAITSPADNDVFEQGSDILIAADATDQDGTVISLEFFVGNESLGKDFTAPYSAALENVAAGTYSLTATVLDNDGATVTSAHVTIKVNGSSGGCDYPEWDPDQNWTTYHIDDRRSSNGAVWKCHNIAYSHWKPSGPYGHFGWTYIQDCP